MRRTTLILLIVLVVVVVAGGAYAMMNKEKVRQAFGGKNANVAVTVTTNKATNAANTAAPTNVPIKTGTAPKEVKGDVAADTSITVGKTTVHISSLQKTASFMGTDAAKGKEFFVVYFDALTSDAIVDVQSAFMAGTSVVTGGQTIPMQKLKIASTAITGDRGFIAFQVPAGSKTFVMKIGTGDGAQSVNLKL